MVDSMVLLPLVKALRGWGQAGGSTPNWRAYSAFNRCHPPNSGIGADEAPNGLTGEQADRAHRSRCASRPRPSR